MPINNATILEGCTIAATGGTSKTLEITNARIPGGVQVADFSVSDFRIRPTYTFRSRPAAPLKVGIGFSKSKNTVSITRPKLLANGTYAYPVRRIEIEDHPEMSLAESQALTLLAAQILIDTDFAKFRENGSLA